MGALVNSSSDYGHLLPPAAEVRYLFVWHQGGLGDLLLAGPALVALRRRYVSARLVVAGNPARWRLLAEILSLSGIWNSGEALWSALYLEDVPLPPGLVHRLAEIDLALVFSPRPRPVFLKRLTKAGVSRVFWLPSFPSEEGEHVVRLQAKRLAELGLAEDLSPLKLNLNGKGAGGGDEGPNGPLLTVAPGSGHPAKNWPLSHYYEVTRALSWEAGLKVVWLAGPAEAELLPYLKGLAAAQDQVVWANQPLIKVARLLARTKLYLGGDSGLTHLAAAAGAQRVVALFGPTDPRVWAPLGENVTVLTASTSVRSETRMADLSVERVLEEVRRVLD
jgi:heptosyltransferase-3|uniref:Lipopolysaccharide heptosyltransferase family protein n=1 Tax=Desulfobacca acetoxidans TaxID=60893 RepID=A0A7C5AMX7_9BACT